MCQVDTFTRPAQPMICGNTFSKYATVNLYGITGFFELPLATDTKKDVGRMLHVCVLKDRNEKPTLRPRAKLFCKQ